MLIFVGVIGFSARKFDTIKAAEYLRDSFDRISKMTDYTDDIYIISGYTDMGVPAMAYRLAEEYNWKTIGLACKKALEWDLYPVDKEMIVGEVWGDESPTLINMSDILVSIGGGNQAKSELKMFKTLYPSKPVFEYDLEELK